MNALLAALAAWLGGALASWLVRDHPGRTRAIGAASALAGCALAAFAAGSALAGHTAQLATVGDSALYGALDLRLDALAAAFLLPICVIGALCAVSGLLGAGRSTAGTAPTTGAAAYNALLASMAIVTVSANLLLLLAAWEIMTFASYALVVTDQESTAARRAGLGYLVASQLAAGALLLLFLHLSGGGAAWEMARLGAERANAPYAWLFLLLLIGFGTKAAVVPFHIWLPGAHAAAPAHVSALMSGVMITMGFYGIARFLPLLGPPAAGAAYALIALGASGACGAALLALAERDVKRVLAYSTVENAGLVTLAIGVGVLGQSRGVPAIAVLGWSAALFHIWSHALAKSLLFGGIGAVAHALHTRDLEAWGGVLRRAPILGALAVVGGLAVAAVPGLGGFVGEWLVLRALFEGALRLDGSARVVLAIGIPIVALTAALTIAAQARLLGIGLLGEPRRAAVPLPPPTAPVTAALGVLAGLCIVLAWVPAFVIGALTGAISVVSPAGEWSQAAAVVRPLGGLALALALVVALAAGLRAALVRRGPVRSAVTWDCGYALPAARMQYSAASLAEPILSAFAPLLHTRIERRDPEGPWPVEAHWRSRTPDRTVTGVYRPALGGFTAVLLRLRDLQEPRVTTYLRYVVLALLVALGLLFLPVVVHP